VEDDNQIYQNQQHDYHAASNLESTGDNMFGDALNINIDNNRHHPEEFEDNGDADSTSSPYVLQMEDSNMLDEKY
jgi:hypothetical protein